ncbi:hypothetical protein HDV00_003234 [Rhizophlyctis rosea]|nr:hypothetical protein HDV00_003234 [Rhizophlyctis rosea]
MSESSKPASETSAFGGGIKLLLGAKGKKAGERRGDTGFDTHTPSSKSKGTEEFVMEIEGDRIHGANGPRSTGPLVIPLIKKNVWYGTVETPSDTPSPSADTILQKRSRSPSPGRSKSADTPPPSTNGRAGTPGPEDEAARAPSPPPLKWGLQIRKKQKVETGTPSPLPSEAALPPSETSTSHEPAKTMSLDDQAIAALLADANGTTENAHQELQPILAQNAVPGMDRLASDVDKYRHDVNQRPEEATLDDYERIPIEEFGSALLRGMGWEKGKAVGKNGRGLVEPIINKPRPHLLGLGATPAPPEKKEKKYIKPGEKRDPSHVREGERKKPATPDYDDRPRSSRNSSARNSPAPPKATPSAGIQNGTLVRIIDGTHKGKQGRVEEIKERSSGTVVKVQVEGEKDLVRVWLDQVKQADVTNGKSSRHSSPANGKEVRSTVNQRSWLIPNIRLRIISKSFKSGRYYNQKGVVQDVVTAGECIVRTETGDLVEGVSQKHVETYIPATGKTVIVVDSSDPELRGHIGKIKEKNNDQERAVVQMEHSLEYHTFTYDQITEHLDIH